MLHTSKTITTTAVDDHRWQDTSRHNAKSGVITPHSRTVTTTVTPSLTHDDSFSEREVSELEAILAKIATPDKESLDVIKQATERQTLDDKVAQEPGEQGKNKSHERVFTTNLGYGDQGESYTLTVPGYKGGRDSYTVNYVSQAIEANESMTKTQYETELDGRDYYEAALDVAERVIEEQSGGRKQTVFDLSLEEREKKELFKFFHPQEWFMMCENATLYKLCRLMM